MSACKSKYARGSIAGQSAAIQSKGSSSRLSCNKDSFRFQSIYNKLDHFITCTYMYNHYLICPTTIVAVTVLYTTYTHSNKCVYPLYQPNTASSLPLQNFHGMCGHAATEKFENSPCIKSKACSLRKVNSMQNSTQSAQVLSHSFQHTAWSQHGHRFQITYTSTALRTFAT